MKGIVHASGKLTFITGNNSPIARELIDKQWNSVVFRMRSDLVKKNGKGSK
jgi:hypothetical protein